MVSGPAQYGATALMLRCTKGDGKPGASRCRPGAGLSLWRSGKALPDRPAFQPYWGKPAVRNERGDRGNVGIIRSPVRASILPDCGGRSVMGVPTAIKFPTGMPTRRGRNVWQTLLAGGGEVDGFLGASEPAYKLDPGHPKHPRLRHGPRGPGARCLDSHPGVPCAGGTMDGESHGR